jgi:hypothetical protein
MIILMITGIARAVITGVAGIVAAGVARIVTTGVAGIVAAGVARIVAARVAGIVTTGVARIVTARVTGIVTTGIAGMRREAVVVAEAASGLVTLLGKVALLGPVATLRRVARLSFVVTAVAPTRVARLPGVVIVLVPAQARGWIAETGPPVAGVRPRVVQVRVPATTKADLRQAGAKVRRAILVIWVRLAAEARVTGMVRVMVRVGGIAGIQGGLAAEAAPGMVAARMVTAVRIRPAVLVGR